MQTRDLGDGRTMRRPVLDAEQLTTGPADLTGEFEHELVRVDGGDQSEVDGGGSLAGCTLTGVELGGATLHPLTMDDVRLEQIELSNTVLREVVARRVELVRCRCVGLRLDLRQVTDLYVEGCRFDYATLRVTQVKGRVAFRECTFREATLYGALTDMIFVDCDFTGTTFDAVGGATGCDLRSSRLVGATGLLTLRGALISADQAVSIADRLATEAGLRIVD